MKSTSVILVNGGPRLRQISATSFNEEIVLSHNPLFAIFE